MRHAVKASIPELPIPHLYLYHVACRAFWSA